MWLKSKAPDEYYIIAQNTLSWYTKFVSLYYIFVRNKALMHGLLSVFPCALVDR